MKAPIANRKSTVRKSSIFSRQSDNVDAGCAGRSRRLFVSGARCRRGRRSSMRRRGPISPRARSRARITSTRRARTVIGDRAAVAAAAARAGLKFVILTDHGDGTRPPDPPAYIERRPRARRRRDQHRRRALRRRSTCRARRIHSAAPPRPSSRTCTGSAGSASPRIPIRPSRRCGGPDDRARRRRHRMAEHRQRMARRVARPPGAGRPGVLPAAGGRRGQPVRSSGDAGSLGALTAARGRSWRWRRPTRTEESAARRRTRAGSLPGLVGIPSYEASFRAFSNRVVLERPLSGDAAADARADLRSDPEGERLLRDRRTGRARARSTSHVEAGQDRIGMGGRAAGRLRRDDRRARVAAARRRTGPAPRRPRGGRRARRDSACRDRRAWGLPDRSPDPGAPGEPAIPGWCRIRSISALSADGQGWLSSRPCTAQAPRGAGAAAFRRFRGGSKRTPPRAPSFARAGDEVSLEYKLGAGERNNQFVASPPTFRGRRSPRSTCRWRGTGRSGFGPGPDARTAAVGPVVLRRSRPGRFCSIPLSTLKPIGGDHAVPRFRRPTSPRFFWSLDLANSAPGRSGVLRVRVR